MNRARRGWSGWSWRCPAPYSRRVNVDQVRDAYSSVAELYISLFGTSQQVHADDLAFIGRHLSAVSGPVLDVGCGPGHITAYLRSLGADASGIDLVPEFIAYAKATHPDVPFRLGSMQHLDLEDASVAGILTWYSLIHYPPAELDGVLARLRRVVAPGGTLVIGFFDGPDIAAFDHKVTTAYWWPPDELSARLARAGFAEVDRDQRPRDGTVRSHAAIAATAC